MILRLLWWCLALPSWSKLESQLPKNPPPVYESLADAIANYENEPPVVLFRDKQGLSASAQQLWLALEVKGAEYVTVLLPEETTTEPWVLWPDGTKQTDPLQILERIQEEYADRPPDLYKRVSKAVDTVRCNILRFDPVFPRNTDPTQHAPYLFRNGNLTARSSHMVSLEETDEILEEYDDGPFFCGGAELSAADIFWAPHLERYAAQLPLTHSGDMLQPRVFDGRRGRYGAIEEWFDAMEQQVPCYSCRVGGDSVSWENVLIEAVEKGLVPNIELVPSRGNPRVPGHRLGDKAKALWDEYRATRPYLCSTPEKECVAYIVRNRNQIIADAAQALKFDIADVEQSLLETVGALLGRTEVSKLSGDARDVAAFLDKHIRVPRDLGQISAACLRALVAAAPKPRIKAG